GGTVGPQKVRNIIRGAAYIDAATGRTVSFRAMGEQEIPEPNGGDKLLGKDEVDYQIVLRPVENDPDLADDVVSALPEANERTTTLVFENPLLGIRFHHPRRWGLVPVPGEDV